MRVALLSNLVYVNRSVPLVPLHTDKTLPEIQTLCNRFSKVFCIRTKVLPNFKFK